MGPGARALVADFLGFARGRSAAAIGLIVAGALLEGAGIIILVPIVSLILGAGGADGAGMIASAFARRGIESSGTRLAVVLAAFACLLWVRFAVLLWRDGLLARLQAEFVSDLRSRAFRHLARASWAEVAGVRQAPVGHALTRDVDRAAGGVTAMIQAGVAAVMLAVQFVLALALAPLVSLAAAALGLGLLRGLRGLRARAARRGRGLTRSDLALFESVGGFLRGLKPAKAHGLEAQYVAAFEKSARRVADEYRAFTVEITIGRLILQTAAGLTGVLVTVLGLFVFDTPPESLIVTLIILARLYTPLQVMQNTAQIVRHAAEGYRMARELAGPVGRAEPPCAPLPAAPLAVPPEIALVEVTVTGGPSAARPLLERVSAVLPAGAVTALIGESGAGKSTFCDLAVGLLAPDAGEVRLDGRPLRDELVGRLRASLAYVGQEPFLFEDSLRGNLCWGCGPVDDAEVWRVLGIVGAAGLARGLEGGLDGSIRAEGMRFSGGERQRLRLARALLRRPRVLVLDEATSALDLEAEAAVLRAVLAARDGATVLMVSHRPATLSLADHVIVLEDGRLREAGPVTALARRAESRVRAALGSAGGPPGQQAAQK
jgi:ABC-type multidrug transport system fused ATPase/permease subunit